MCCAYMVVFVRVLVHVCACGGQSNLRCRSQVLSPLSTFLEIGSLGLSLAWNSPSEIGLLVLGICVSLPFQH